MNKFIIDAWDSRLSSFVKSLKLGKCGLRQKNFRRFCLLQCSVRSGLSFAHAPDQQASILQSVLTNSCIVILAIEEATKTSVSEVKTRGRFRNYLSTRAKRGQLNSGKSRQCSHGMWSLSAAHFVFDVCSDWKQSTIDGVSLPEALACWESEKHEFNWYTTLKTQKHRHGQIASKLRYLFHTRTDSLEHVIKQYAFVKTLYTQTRWCLTIRQRKSKFRTTCFPIAIYLVDKPEAGML